MSKKIIIQEDSVAKEATPTEAQYILEWQEEASQAEKQTIEEQELKENLKASANAKLLALGLTEAEVAALTA